MATRQEAREAREATLDELHERLIGALARLMSGPGWARALPFSTRFRSGNAAQVKTLAQLGHVLLHSPDHDEARRRRGVGDVEAESIALMICAAHGIDSSSCTIPYSSTWAASVDGKEPAEVVKATGVRVRKTALAILNQIDTVQIGDGTPPGLHRDAAHGEVPTRTRPAPEPASPGWVASLRGPGARSIPVPVFEGRGL